MTGISDILNRLPKKGRLAAALRFAIRFGNRSLTNANMEA
jgi:hypothetical protein